jgi:hypothetical protein
MPLPPFYTARFVEVRSWWLSVIWLTLGVAIVLGQMAVMFGNYGFAVKRSPEVDVAFWQDVATDGSGQYWVQRKSPHEPHAAYCSNTTYFYDDSRAWGGAPIGCINPNRSVGTYVYPSPNELLFATSVARALPGQDPQWQSSQVFMYEGVEDATIMLKPSYATEDEVVEHVQDCRVITASGKPGPATRYPKLHPKADYGPGCVRALLCAIVVASC